MESSLNLVGAAGTLFFMGILLIPFFNLSNLPANLKNNNHLWASNLKGVVLYSLISSVLLACSFSFIGVPLVHGGQLLPLIFMILGVQWLVGSGRIPFALGSAQVVVNTLLFSIYLLKLK